MPLWGKVIQQRRKKKKQSAPQTDKMEIRSPQQRLQKITLFFLKDKERSQSSGEMPSATVICKKTR